VRGILAARRSVFDSCADLRRVAAEKLFRAHVAEREPVQSILGRFLIFGHNPAARRRFLRRDAGMAIAYFDLPLNLPHAGRVAERIRRLVEQRAVATDLRFMRLGATAEALDDLLTPYRLNDEDPPIEKADPVRRQAAELGRRLVDEIARSGLGEDRLGQCIRNLFECLALGEEGALISLRAGEDPGSLQRPC
jgi:hypothetical protein